MRSSVWGCMFYPPVPPDLKTIASVSFGEGRPR
jgi:hypothetical protein